MNYNIQTHPLTINWFNSKALKAIQLGENEKNIKHSSKSKYPENTICVKVNRLNILGKISGLEITFVGKSEEKSTWSHPPRQTILLYRSSSYQGVGSWVYANSIDKISFGCGTTFSLLDMRQKLDYIDYILKQVRDASLE
tara:strand:- start:3108 stop:3527 length:420 start_codon:yes stop_codon:yes gene_type:complete